MTSINNELIKNIEILKSAFLDSRKEFETNRDNMTRVDLLSFIDVLHTYNIEILNHLIEKYYEWKKELVENSNKESESHIDGDISGNSF